ncbi:MAG TPA: hypothetical protein VGW37_14970 [Terriglobia bacterium]|nr:hypothetical protein [Terriglobia bacterium]
MPRSAVHPALWPLGRVAAGNLLWDGGSNYENDAEGRAGGVDIDS